MGATISTQASAGGPLGTSVTDTATVTGVVSGPTPTGTVTFTLFDNPTCTGAPVFTSANRPLGGGTPPTATSTAFTPTAADTYFWIASYSEDLNYAPLATACGDPNESVVITRANPTI